MKKIIYFSVATLLAFLLSSSAKAATITPGPLTITYLGEGSIFSETNLSPGSIVQKELTVTNNGRVNHNFAIATTNVIGYLGDIITLSAIDGTNTVWTSSLKELENSNSQSKFVTNLAPAETKTITLRANFPIEKGSAYAGKTVSFDMIYGTEESEPVRSFQVLSANSISSEITPTAIVSPSETSSVESGEVKGQESNRSGFNPWYLVIAPAAVLASVVLLPEFAVVGALTAVSGTITYVLGYSSSGQMNPTTFYIALVIEIITLVTLAYFMLHHDNRASRKIRNYHHRLRIR